MWVSFFKEVAAKLVEYEHRQDELLATLKACGISVAQDQNADDEKIDLTEMDPFSFFSEFMKHKSAKRLLYFKKLKSLWEIKADLTDHEHFEGVPNAVGFNSWFFPFLLERPAENVAHLWKFFKQIQRKKIDEATWKYVTTQIKTVRVARITQGLCWIDGERFFPVDSQTTKLLRDEGLPYEVSDLKSYYNLLEVVKKHFKKPFHEVSHLAWLANQSVVAESKPEYRIANAAEFPLNTILFGPPGTGKTYHTTNYALAIVEGKSLETLAHEPRSTLKQRFDEYIERGQIAFTTFHPSFSYEDFVEGIKPKMHEGGENNEREESSRSALQYEIRKGIFRSISERAASYQAFTASDDFSFPKAVVAQLDHINFGKISLGNGQSEESKAVYQFCLENNRIALDWGNDYDCTTYQNEADLRQSLFALGETNPSSIEFLKRFIFSLKPNDIILIPDDQHRIRAIGQIKGSYFYEKNDRIPHCHFRPVEWLVQDVNIPIEEVYARKFSPQTVYLMYHDLIKKDFFQKLPPDKSLKNHVLVIDEINRGNVANIFGELITLLETDKRMGNAEAISVTLPYSKEAFFVPSNLYILGTMNTADRSVEALDTALRRRFVFQEMPPDPSQIVQPTHLDVDLRQLLTTLNRRLEVLLDRDHAIGHSYFMQIHSLHDLQNTFAHNILPLLQEFFYHDFGKIGMILGSTFVQRDTSSAQSLAKGFSFDNGAFFDEKVLYRLANPHDLDESAFRAVYA